MARIWLKLDTAFHRHPKVKPLPDRAFRLHVAALLHCKEFLTDGRITRAEVQDLLRLRDFPTAAVSALCKAGLWHEDGAGWVIHDFLAHNNSRDQVMQIRRLKAVSGQAGARERWGKR
jgi:hypothetical protein